MQSSPAPKAPLWALLVASEALDLLCFAFMAAGIENMGVSQADLLHGIRVLTPPSLAWSHGLFMSLVWSVFAAGLAYLVFRDKRTGPGLIFSALLDVGLLIGGIIIYRKWSKRT